MDVWSMARNSQGEQGGGKEMKGETHLSPEQCLSQDTLRSNSDTPKKQRQNSQKGEKGLLCRYSGGSDPEGPFCLLRSSPPAQAHRLSLNHTSPTEPRFLALEGGSAVRAAEPADPSLNHRSHPVNIAGVQHLSGMAYKQLAPRGNKMNWQRRPWGERDPSPPH